MKILIRNSKDNHSRRLESLYLAATLATELDPRIDQVIYLEEPENPTLTDTSQATEPLKLLMAANIKRLALLGISERDLIEKCDGRFSYGRIYNRIVKPNGKSLFLSDCQVGINFDGVDFHQYYLAKSDFHSSYQQYCLGYLLEKSNRFIHPNHNSNSALSSLDYNICVDGTALQKLLELKCVKRRVDFRFEQMSKTELIDLELNFNTDLACDKFKENYTRESSSRCSSIEIDTTKKLVRHHLCSASKESLEHYCYSDQVEQDDYRFINENQISVGLMLSHLSGPILSSLYQLEYIIQNGLSVLTNPISKAALCYLNNQVSQHIIQYQALSEIAYSIFDNDIELSELAEQVVGLFSRRGELIQQDYSWLPKNIWVALLMHDNSAKVFLSSLFNCKSRQKQLSKLEALQNQIKLTAEKVPTQSQYINYLNTNRIKQNG